MKSIIFAFTLVGTFVGAGFATGQEMVSFFNLHNPLNPLYFIFSCFIIYLTCYFSKSISSKGDSMSLFTALFGIRGGKLMNIISLLSLFICYGASAAGMGAVFYENFSLPYLLGAFLLVVLSFFICTKGMKGIDILNSLLTPVIIIGIVFLGISVIKKAGFLSIPSEGNFTVSSSYSLLYAGYNIFPLISIVLTYKKQKPSGYFYAFLFTSFCGVILFYTLSSCLDISYVSSVPFYTIIRNTLPSFSLFYGIVICMALLTTGVSSLYGFIAHIEKNSFIKRNTIYSICFVATFFFLLFGFTKTVRVFYPISGFFGVILISRLLFKEAVHFKKH